jgi:predicted nucleic acid-binding protein
MVAHTCACARRSFRRISFLLDDADARREAARRNVPFIGTLGTLEPAIGLEPMTC